MQMNLCTTYTNNTNNTVKSCGKMLALVPQTHTLDMESIELYHISIVSSNKIVYSELSFLILEMIEIVV